MNPVDRRKPSLSKYRMRVNCIGFCVVDFHFIFNQRNGEARLVIFGIVLNGLAMTLYLRAEIRISLRKNNHRQIFTLRQ